MSRRAKTIRFAPRLPVTEVDLAQLAADGLPMRKGMTLADALSADPRVSRHIDRATIDRLTSPGNYLGLAPQMVDGVLGGLTAMRERAGGLGQRVCCLATVFA